MRLVCCLLIALFGYSSSSWAFPKQPLKQLKAQMRTEAKNTAFYKDAINTEQKPRLRITLGHWNRPALPPGFTSIASERWKDDISVPAKVTITSGTSRASQWYNLDYYPRLFMNGQDQPPGWYAIPTSVPWEVSNNKAH